MMIMIQQRKIYLGKIQTEQEAAKYYDILAFLSQGINAKTNYSYTASQLQNIIEQLDFMSYDSQEQNSHNESILIKQKQDPQQSIKNKNEKGTKLKQYSNLLKIEKSL